LEDFSKHSDLRFSNFSHYASLQSIGHLKRADVKIVELPIKTFPFGTPSGEVIKALGLPDDKSKVFVSWPDSKRIDGIFYNPRAGGAAMAEHWRYKDYPGLVVSIMNGTVYEIASNIQTEKRGQARLTAVMPKARGQVLH
jgi:hypothetical protein